MRAELESRPWWAALCCNGIWNTGGLYSRPDSSWHWYVGLQTKCDPECNTAPVTSHSPAAETELWLMICLLQSSSHTHMTTSRYSTVQYSTVQYSTVQYSTVQYSTAATLTWQPHVVIVIWSSGHHFINSSQVIIHHTFVFNVVATNKWTNERKHLDLQVCLAEKKDKNNKWI